MTAPDDRSAQCRPTSSRSRVLERVSETWNALSRVGLRVWRLTVVAFYLIDAVSGGASWMGALKPSA